MLPILWIVGVQFIENVRFYGCSLVSQLVYNNCGRPALISILCFYYVDNCQGGTPFPTSCIPILLVTLSAFSTLICTWLATVI